MCENFILIDNKNAAILNKVKFYFSGE